MKSKLSIGAKLGSGFGFLLVIIVVMVCFGVNSTRNINESLKDIVKERTVKNRLCDPGVQGG